MTTEQKIRAIMKETGWKQQKLAEIFSVSQSTVNRWLSGSEPEGPRRDAINEAYARYVPDRQEGSRRPEWRDQLERQLARMDGAPESMFLQIVSYARGTADTWSAMRETATTPDT
ncbi:MAG: XRE family transcriptional regulator [Mesorhizobium sp.]|nr:MAG: XRE family transcriptional regulator [Mesorhizobium sp.]